MNLFDENNSILLPAEYKITQDILAVHTKKSTPTAWETNDGVATVLASDEGMLNVRA